MSKNNSKSLATLRQKLRKYIKDKDYDSDMAKFRENPDLPDEDEEKGRSSHIVKFNCNVKTWTNFQLHCSFR